MIIAAILMLAPPQPAAGTARSAAVQDEIVVIARKLKEWQGYVRLKNGVAKCKTTKSTKDAVMDKIACDSAILCTTPELEAAYAAIESSDISEAERAGRASEFNRKATECTQTAADAQVTALAEQRAAVQ